MPPQKRKGILETTEQPAGQRLKGLELKLEDALGIPFTSCNKVEVLTNGTEIFPAMLQARIIYIDDAISCIGSANFNHRSMLKEDEVNLVLIDPGISQTLNKQFVEDLKNCEKVDEGQWKNRSLMRRGMETATKLIKQQI